MERNPTELRMDKNSMTPSIWTGMYAELPLHNALRTLHECGWQTFEISTEHLVAIETGNDPDKLIAETQKCVQELNLSTPQAHALLHANVAAASELDRERDIQRLKRHMRIAASLGVTTVIIHPGGGASKPGTERDAIRKLNIQAFRRLGDFASERNMRIGIENMPYPEFTRSLELLELLRLIDHPAIGINLDTSHANMCALDIPAMIHDLDSHLIATHISDNNGTGDQHLHPGGGTIHWQAVMRALRDIGYNGTLNLEIPGERHKAPALRRLKTRFALEVAQWLAGL